MTSDDFIRSRLPLEELLAGLAEEATELAQAALKCRRAITGINPTPKTQEEAFNGFLEEAGDIKLYLDIILPNDEATIKAVYQKMREKRERWVMRLKEVAE